MRLTVRFSRVVLVGVVTLALGVVGGCNGNANEDEEMMGEAPANAPMNQEEFAKQQMQLQGEAEVDQ